MDENLRMIRKQVGLRPTMWILSKKSAAGGVCDNGGRSPKDGKEYDGKYDDKEEDNNDEREEYAEMYTEFDDVLAQAEQ